MKINKDLIFGLMISFIVFLFFSHTLNYPWKYFDEQIIYNETVLPVPRTWHEIFEYFKYFGINNYFEASNPFYSSISNVRRVPLDNVITLFVFYFFQKNVFAYHLCSLILHTLNTFILFLLINKTSNVLIHSDKIRLSVVTLLTLLWATHPTNVEAVLFTTNWSVMLTYSLCIFFLFYFVENIHKEDSKLNFLITFILYAIPLSTREYPIVIPAISFLLAYNFYTTNHPQTTIIKAINFSIKKTLPLFLALGIFTFFFINSPSFQNIQSAYPNSFPVTIERIFYLSPQIFFHSVKLILFPLHLSIDETAMVKLADSLFDHYSIFCCILMCTAALSIPASMFLNKNKVLYTLTNTFALFFIALIPFLHIFSPAYCFSSERYLYFPLFVLVLGLSNFIFFISSGKGFSQQIPLISILVLTLTIFSTRAYLRTFDWKDSLALFTSALNEGPNDLIKGLRQNMLGNLLTAYYKDNESQTKGVKYINDSINTLEQSLLKLETENIKFKNNSPKIIKVYGLDKKSIQAKTAYLLANIKLGLDKNITRAYETLKPHMEDLTVLDTQILDLYLGILFSLNKTEEAERILKFATNRKLSPITLYIYSELKIKENDLTEAEKYLKKSFEYFPYDPPTLFGLKNLYYRIGRQGEFEHFSHLYGLRMHNLKESYEN